MNDAAPASFTEHVSDFDTDSLFILPLAIVPIQTPSLRRARLIKNVRLESVVEMFESATTGSGQMVIEELPGEFGWPEVPVHHDLRLLRKLSVLPSFDVYSLRVLLRESGIPVNSNEALRLSKQKNQELTGYMADFTRPLILNVYGDDDVDVNSFEDIVGLFRDPDVKKALSKLKILARRLEIELDHVPKFLEDYGDIFLSLAYYRQALDYIAPSVGDFLAWTEELCGSYQAKQDPNLITTCRTIEALLNSLMVSIAGRFENFDRSTQNLWSSVSAERFRRVENLIKSYHTTIGGVLCALTVKIETWARLFPHKSAGGPSKRAEFIMNEMRQGIDKIQKIEDSAPMLSGLD